MSKAEALALVIELAEQNRLTLVVASQDEGLMRERKRQQQAFRIVNQLHREIAR